MSYLPQGGEIFSGETGALRLNRQNKWLRGMLNIAELCRYITGRMYCTMGKIMGVALVDTWIGV